MSEVIEHGDVWTCDNCHTPIAMQCKCSQCSRIRQYHREIYADFSVGQLAIAAAISASELVARGVSTLEVYREYMTKEQFKRFNRDVIQLATGSLLQ